MTSLLPPDFWWLPEDLFGLNLGVRVAEAPAIGPDDSAAGLTHYDGIVVLSDLSRWASTRPNCNLHRSLAVYAGDSIAASGPLVIDIDADSMEGGTQEDTWPVASLAICLLRDLGLSDGEMRLLDSGHKGYNIEVRPDNSHEMDQRTLRAFLIRGLRQGNAITSSTQNQVAARVLIDPSKPYLRVWNTSNIWLDQHGNAMQRLKREIPLHEA